MKNALSISASTLAIATTFNLLQSPAIADTTELPNVAHHWLANSGGTKESHVQNFVTDLTVIYSNEYPATQNPLVLAASFWDEGGYGYGAYSQGKVVGKAERWRTIIHSDTAVYKGLKCKIGNFWGRSFLGRCSAPPKGDSAPFISCSNGDTLRDVLDPTAIVFDRSGRLLVADNSPDQDIKIYSTSPFRRKGTFGDSGGVFARPKTGATATSTLPGAVGPRRFWGIRGLAVDTQGILYVANTGIPMQTMGGTDLRAFSPKDSSMLWQLQGLSFVNTADADPSSKGRDLYLNAKRFQMDWSQPAGKSWKLQAVTLDPFRFPLDPRIQIAMESVWERRIQGKRFQYHTDMVGGFVYVARFEDSSEIGIPTAFFCTFQDFPPELKWWVYDSMPSFVRNETNKRLRWYWVDRNGDGTPQKSEFGIWENWNIYSQALDIDEEGNIWLGGKGDTTAYFKEGGTTEIRVGGLDARGVPRFPMDSIGRWSVPFAENGGATLRIKRIAAGDRAYLATGASTWYPAAIHSYRNFTNPSKRTEGCRIDLGYDDRGEKEVHLDVNTARMTIPFSFTADSEYVYVVYLDNGRYSRRRGEVTVYSANTCQPVGWMAPDSTEGFFAGAMDLVNAVNVSVLPDGRRLVLEEEDGAGKVLAYIWQPPARRTASVESGPSPASHPAIRWRRGVLEVTGLQASHWSRARLVDAGGRTRADWELSSAPTDRLELPATASRTTGGVLVLQAEGRRLALGVPPAF